MSQNGKRKIGWTPESKHNMRLLLKALLSVAEGELKIDDNPQLQQGVLTQWRTNTELRVTGKIGKFEGTTLQTLADMVKTFGDYLEPKDKITNEEERDKLRNVIHCLEALKLLVDERDKDKKNTPYWKFTLKIKDRFASQEENIRWIETQWRKPSRLQSVEINPNNNFQLADKQPIFQIPYLRNPYFKGRDEILNRIHTNFTLQKQSTYIQVITGAGGFGKTQLAAEYAYLNKQEYDIVWWIRSEEAASLASDYANLATELNLPEQQAQDQSIIIKAVLRVLQQNHRWLLVFDNAENPSQLRDYIPRIGYGHVLITSQKQNCWVRFGDLLPIPDLSSNAAVELLLEGTGQTDEQSALELAKELGNLPLALAQASAYIRKTGCSIQRYLELFKDYQKDLLAERIEGSDYPYTIITTWRLALEQIESTFPAAQTLLNLCAFLAPDDIPLELFRRNSEELPENLRFSVLNPLDFENTIAVLQDYSLVQRNKDALSLHRLVQFVTRDRMSDISKKQIFKVVLRLMSKTVKFDYYQELTWKICHQYIYHCIVVLKRVEKIKFVDEYVALLQGNIGQFLGYFGRTNESKKYITDLIKNRNKLLKNKHFLNPEILKQLNIVTASCYNFLGFATTQGNLQEEINYHNKSLEIVNKFSCQNSELVVNVTMCLGCARIRNGEILEGVNLLNPLLEHSMKNQTTSVSVGMIWMILGVAKEKENKFKQALQDYQQAEKYYLKTDNEANVAPDLGVLYYRIGNLYEKIEEIQKAYSYFDKARNYLNKSFLNTHCLVNSFKELREKLGLPDLSEEL